MDYANNPPIYLYVPKLFHLSLKSKLADSPIRFEVSNDIYRFDLKKESTYYRMYLKFNIYGNRHHIVLLEVKAEDVPDNAYQIRVTQLNNYKAIFKMQGLELELPEK